MDIKRHNADLKILQIEANHPRFGEAPGWEKTDWKPTNLGGNMIYLRNYKLPTHCSVVRSDIKIEAPPNLYDPAGKDCYHFYRNIWVSPQIQLWNHRTKKMIPMPRLHGKDEDGFSFLCIHPNTVSKEANILDFLRVLDLFLLNPGYRASTSESY